MLVVNPVRLRLYWEKTLLPVAHDCLSGLNLATIDTQAPVLFTAGVPVLTIGIGHCRAITIMHKGSANPFDEKENVPRWGSSEDG